MAIARKHPDCDPGLIGILVRALLPPSISSSLRLRNCPIHQLLSAAQKLAGAGRSCESADRCVLRPSLLSEPLRRGEIDTSAPFLMVAISLVAGSSSEWPCSGRHGLRAERRPQGRRVNSAQPTRRAVLFQQLPAHQNHWGPPRVTIEAGPPGLPGTPAIRRAHRGLLTLLKLWGDLPVRGASLLRPAS